MIPEFVDLRVRMKPEDERTFRTAISRFPQFNIIDRTKKPVEEPEEADQLAWEDELDDLRVMISAVREAVDSGNQISEQGFRQLNRFNKHLSEEEFRDRFIGALDRSVVAYETEDERPGYKRPDTVFIYRKKREALTPRNIRIAVGIFHLDGEDVDPNLILAREGTHTDVGYYVSQLQLVLGRLID
ncbi:MAG: hypothetical protein AAB512_03395 [Patescibacteria group bacterium]